MLGLCTQWLVPFFGINFEATLKNREIGGALALLGRRSINTFNNHMEVGVQDGGYIEEEPWLGRNVWGGKVPSFLPLNGVSKKKKKNFILALDGRRWKLNQTTYNQKYASAFNNGTKE